jgi:hypothetical protein
LFLVALAAAAFLVSCKKDDDNGGSIQAKWNINKLYFESKTEGSLDSSSFPAAPGDYADFRNDGKVYIRFSNPLTGDPEFDTTGYSLIGNSKLVFIDDSGNDTLDIFELTSNKLVFGGYEEFVDNDNYSLTKIYCSK